MTNTGEKGLFSVEFAKTIASGNPGTCMHARPPTIRSHLRQMFLRHTVLLQVISCALGEPPPTVGTDCPLINVTGAGYPEVDGMYRPIHDQYTTKTMRWSFKNSMIEFQSAKVAGSWLPAPPSPVWGIVHEHSHRYYQRLPATQHGAELAPGLVGWEVRVGKKGGKSPAPVLTCASVSASCTHVLIRSSGVDGLDGTLLERGPPVVRTDEGAAFAKYNGTMANGLQVVLDIVDREDARRWFDKDGAMWGIVFADSSGQKAKHQFLVDDGQAPKGGSASGLCMHALLLFTTAPYCPLLVLFTTVHYCTLLHTTAHHCPLLLTTAHYCPLLLTHCSPLLTTAHHCTLLLPTAPYCSLLLTPLLPTPAHSCPLLHHTAHYCSLLHTITRYCPNLLTPAHDCSLLTTVHYCLPTAHYCSLLHTTAHYCTL